MTQSLPASTNPSASAAMALLAQPSLIAGENAESYNDLLARISGTLQPADILEEIWVRDVVDLVWDAFRLRRLKAHLLKSAAHEGMAQLLGPLLDWNLTGQTSTGIDMNSVMARTLALKIHEVERIDRMTMAAEARRNAVLREIERHRASFARSLRRTVEDVEEADVKMIAAPNAAPAEAA
jgi:hypothetical protein